MLNRLYIVVGVIAILALAAAFIVPAFIPWAAFRDRMEAAASELAGTPVRIAGDIRFTLLPQPRLELAHVSAGPTDAPTVTVDKVEADFSLIDFIRDRYVITRLALQHPVVAAGIGAGGALIGGLPLPAGGSSSSISVAEADLTDGQLLLGDQRSGQAAKIDKVDGTLKLETLNGPFAFQGHGLLGGNGYALRVTAAAPADGSAKLAAFLKPDDGGFSLNLDGAVTIGTAPAFTGAVTFRRPPPKAADQSQQDAGQGDLVMTGTLDASPQKLVLTDYTLLPDENRGATRLTGAAEVALGAKPAFNAVISGGVLAQPPRDVTTEQGTEPYELVRLLQELPIPPVIGIPGTLGVDVAELDLRIGTVRNLRLDATASTDHWTIDRLTAQLTGDTALTLSGRIDSAVGRPGFAGSIKLATRRLDALAALWRKPASGNPLFNMQGSLEARINLVADTLSLSDGQLTLDGATHSFAAQVGFGATRDIHLTAKLGALDSVHSAALFALLPDVQHDPALGVSFPSGEFDFGADQLTIDGLPGRQLAAKGSWAGGVLVADDISADDLGGARVSAKLTAFGTWDKPEVSGSGTVALASADAPVLTRFYDTLQTPVAVRAFLGHSLPASLTLRLDAPSGDGAQSLNISGSAGASALHADAELDAGLIRALSDHVLVRFDLKSPDGDAMTAQLGLGDVSLLGGPGPLHLVGQVEGNVAGSLEMTLLLQADKDSLGFSGNVVVTDPNSITGTGTIKAMLGDPAPAVALVGAGGLHPPSFIASATLGFTGSKSVTLDNIVGTAGGQKFTGALAYAGTGPTRSMTGNIDVGSSDLADWLRLLDGPAALINSGGLWPDGPLDTGAAARPTTGRIHLTGSAVTSGGHELATAVSADLEWDVTNARLRDLTAKMGGGDLALDVGVCCAGPLTAKQLAGRISLHQVNLDALVPQALAAQVDGSIDVAGQFSGTGDSVASALAAMTGDGTYTVSNFSVAGLDPGALGEVAGTAGLLDMQSQDVSRLLISRLDDKPFASPGFTGGFTVAGGVLRSPNLSIEGPAGKLFGSASMRLTDLGLSGEYSVSAPAVTPAALVDASAAKVTADIGGTLTAPTRTFDVSGLVDAIMVAAYQAELTRLEKLKAEADARQKAADEDAARQAAADAAAREAEAAAIKDASDSQPPSSETPPIPAPPRTPMDLGLPAAN